MDKPLLHVSNLGVELNHQVILDGITFDLKKNETVAVIGPNGAGKTTLFRALLGFIPYQGTVEWEKGITIGYVPQMLAIEKDIPITVSEFFNLKGKKYSRSEITDVLALVGFRDDIRLKLLKKKLGVLSGGERQRLLMAWACLGKPDVLLFDEPTSGIDASTEETIYSLLHKLQEHEHLTVVLISHELEIVYKYATNVLCLNKESVCFGPPSKTLDKKNLEALYGADVGIYHHH